MADFIPVGRTSLAKRGATTLQVQTEYAARPNPRIATTITENGRVVHKVERPLEKVIASAEEQRQTEAQMRQQHLTIVNTIEGRNETDKSDTGKVDIRRSGIQPLVDSASPAIQPEAVGNAVSAQAMPQQPTAQADQITMPSVHDEPRHASLMIPNQEQLIIRPFTATHRESSGNHNSIRETLLSDSSRIGSTAVSPATANQAGEPVSPNMSVFDRLRSVAGVQSIFEVDKKGNLAAEGKTTAEFRKLFAPALKNLRQLLTFFVALEDGTREKGLYPIDSGRLYLVSSGDTFFIVLVYAAENPAEIEKRLRASL